jgi:hypothetical protein
MTAPPIPVQAGTAASGAGGALGAMVQLANFVYTIIKDHGHELKMTSTVADKGLSTVPEGIPVTITERWEHGSAWYTHTRAWHGAVHSLYAHDKDLAGGAARPGKDLSSVYLCIVFPFKVTYAVAQPDVDALNEQIAKMELEIKQAKLKAKEELIAKLKEQREKLAKDDALPEAPKKPKRPTRVDDPPVPMNYRTPEQRAQEASRRRRNATVEERQFEEAVAKNDSDYQKALTKYNKDMEKYREDREDYRLELASMAQARKAIRELAPAGDEHIKAQVALLKRKQDFRDRVDQQKNVKYMTDVRIQAEDGFNGLKSTAWQNVKVEAKMELSGNEPIEGQGTSVTVSLNWAERVIGYGKTWTGTITLYPGQEKVDGQGKFVERFKRYAKLNKTA